VAPDHHHDEARPPVLCDHCGDTIGVYEPLVYVDDAGDAVRSSLLRVPDHLRRVRDGAAFFHAACHDARA
jgi:hypothetical protein